MSIKKAQSAGCGDSKSYFGRVVNGRMKRLQRLLGGSMHSAGTVPARGPAVAVSNAIEAGTKIPPRSDRDQVTKTARRQ
jgi:hypothetical protein